MQAWGKECLSIESDRMPNRLTLAALQLIRKRLANASLKYPSLTISVWNDGTNAFEKKLETAGKRVLAAIEDAQEHNAVRHHIQVLINQNSHNSELAQNLQTIRNNIDYLQALHYRGRNIKNMMTLDELQKTPVEERGASVQLEISIFSYMKAIIEEELENLKKEANTLQAKLDVENRKVLVEVPQEIMDYLLEYDYL